ncbi:MAG TPA: hypothetical protein VF601_20675 [Beijerinckiaceae bacterium]|jgi:hypothetical protein
MNPGPRGCWSWLLIILGILLLLPGGCFLWLSGGAREGIIIGVVVLIVAGALIGSGVKR